MDLFVRRTGELRGPPLVFLHGGGVAGWMWDRQAEFFKDYHVIIPDLPGHGGSAEIPFISINDAASKVLTAVRDAVGSEKVNLVGFSLGAQLVVEIMSRWPEKVESAVILSAMVRPMNTGKYFLLSLLKMSFGLSRVKWFSKWQANSLCISKEYRDQYYQDSLKLTRDNFMRVMESNMSYILPDSFANSSIRTLILAGTKELGRMRASAEDMVGANRNCMGYMVLGASHGLSLAEPDLFNEIVFNFLNNNHLHKNKRLERV